MAIFIKILIFLLLLGITFVLYACIVVGKRSMTPKEREYEEQEEIEYIKKCEEVKKQNKKTNLEIKKIKLFIFKKVGTNEKFNNCRKTRTCKINSKCNRWEA